MEQKIKVGDRVVGVGVDFGKVIGGKNGTVKKVIVGYAAVEFDKNIDGWGSRELGIQEDHGWTCHIENLRRITDEPSAPSPAWSIYITPKGNVTHAVFKQGKHLIGHASAFCSPRDTYDATMGAVWAFLRLPGMADAARRVLAEMDGEKAPTPEHPKKRGMEPEECKPGMRVRFRKWEDMEKEYGASARGTILIDPLFTTEMRYLCGTCATVESTDFDTGRVRLKEFESSGSGKWLFAPWMLEPADVADETAPVPQTMYKPGDRVRIVDKWGPGCNQSPNGKMDKWLGKTMTVRGVDKHGVSTIWYKMIEDKREYNGNDTPGWDWLPAAIVGKVGESRREK